jgi:hypothetical protein
MSMQRRAVQKDRPVSQLAGQLFGQFGNALQSMAA